VKMKLYCTCGASGTGTITPDAKARHFVEKIWTPIHSGEGHSPCDAKTAAKARRKADRAEGAVKP
jgi:hypothetical protein